MKARSLILTHVQMPFLLAGVPPFIAIGLFALGICVTAIGFGFGRSGTGFFGGIGLVVVIWTYVKVKLRRDPHIYGMSFRASRFWRGDIKRRVFVAGQRPDRKRRAPR